MPYKYEDLNLNPRTHVKPGMVVFVDNPSAPTTKWRQEQDHQMLTGQQALGAQHKEQETVSIKVEGED